MIDDPGTEASLRDMLEVLFLTPEQRLPKPYYQDEWATLYHADCRDVLPLVGPVDLVLTDPPYGVNIKRGDSKIQEKIRGDAIPPDVSTFAHYPAIIWGGNNFCDQLPRSTGWLVWFKHFPDMCRHSQAELAWTNIVKTIRHFSLQFSGFMKAPEGWFHPTQKPIALMRWCLSFAPHAQLILDPFAGSGTTLVAAKQLGRKSIGIEIEEKYCAIAAERLRNTTPSLFVPPPPKPEQLPLLEDH